MKTLLFAVVGLALALPVWGDEPAKLEIHEWGTFTVVSGSDGRPLQWYQPASASAELPSFVGRSILLSITGKNGRGTLELGNGRSSVPYGPAASYVRMETPVIYFYPQQSMKVSAQVSFADGRFTEWFPAPWNPGQPSPISTGVVPWTIETKLTWNGELLPPDDMVALSKIPKVEGKRDTHYGHAREVPKAWIFHSAAPANPAPTQGGQVAPQPWEKFIFYRGAGDALPAFEAHALDDHRMKMYRFDQGDAPIVVFALQVEGAQARWKRMPDLAARSKDSMSPATISEVLLEKEPQLSLAQVSEQLGSAMAGELITAGLSPDEAKAMVATWSDSWFRENGSRVFALLPRAWVDSVLPLEITPRPEKMTRVFVGRFETFTASQENTLLTLLAPQNNVDAATRTKFADLHLGRFGYAALQRAHNLMDLQFRLLESAALRPTTAAR